MKKLVFLQPVVPKYRVSFFKKLSILSDYRVLVCASKEDFLGVRTYPDPEVELVYQGAFKKLGPFYWLTKFRTPKLGKDDVVVISGNPRIVNYMLYFLFQKALGRQVIWWGQGWSANKRGFLSKLRRKLMILADGIAVYTDNEAKEINHANVVGLNNGLDVANFPPVYKKFCSNDNISLLFIGRVTKKSELDILINALTKITVNYHLHIIGDGPLTDVLKLQTFSDGTENFVSWYGEVLDDNEIKSIARKCDVFIYPGAVGLSLIHAFCLSLPAIVHNDTEGHMPEIAAFRERYNGITFDKGNATSLAKVINNLSLSDINNMSQNARSTVENSFNTTDMAKRFISLIR